MFFRVTKVKRAGRVHKYGYVVESYRRESDGQPMQRTLLKLGKLTDREIANYQVAFEAQKSGARVVVANEQGPLPQPLANLEYLDVAVLLETWKGWGLSELLDQLMGGGSNEVAPSVAPSMVVAALTCQRCVAPGSKLDATRWIPTTALPELFGVAPISWNNSRIHRVLDQLAAVDNALQQALGHRYKRRDGAFVALHIDTTDAVFEGHGPPQAKLSKWKDGALKRRIGIALLCNEHGYPLRWGVVDGRAVDCHTFVDVARGIKDQPWAQNVPVIMDRAAGSTATVEELLDTGLHVLTPLRRTEFAAYIPTLPTELFEDLDDLEVTGDPEPLRLAALERAKTVFDYIDDSLLVRDFDVLRRRTAKGEPTLSSSTPTDDVAVDRDKAQRLKDALAFAREATEAVQSGQCASLAAFARQRGVAKSVVTKRRWLLRLSPELLDAIERGQLALFVAQLAKIAKLPQDQHAAAVEALAAPREVPKAKTPTPPPQVRCVAYFNPDIFVTRRINAADKLARVRKAVADLNTGLRERTRSKREIGGAMDRLLQAEGLLRVFSYRIETIGRKTLKRRQVVLGFDADEWQKRRRYDGFSVLVGHPKLSHNATDLCKLYRQRACIEHDFRTIKSFIDICPIQHRLERKVRAHVTICMLALLLERTLGRQLDQAGLQRPSAASHEARLTAPAALELLATCHLNQFTAQGYSLTQLTPDQREILTALGLGALGENGEIADKVIPR